MPKFSVDLSTLIPLVGWLNVRTRTHSRVCTAGILPFLQTKFPTLRIEEEHDYNGKRILVALASQNTLAVEKLDQFVEFVQNVKGPGRLHQFFAARIKPKPYAEVLVLKEDLAGIMEWLVQHCDPSEYIIISKYSDCLMVCLVPDKALRFKLWYPSK